MLDFMTSVYDSSSCYTLDVMFPYFMTHLCCMVSAKISRLQHICEHPDDVEIRLTWLTLIYVWKAQGPSASYKKIANPTFRCKDFGVKNFVFCVYFHVCLC